MIVSCPEAAARLAFLEASAPCVMWSFYTDKMGSRSVRRFDPCPMGKGPDGINDRRLGRMDELLQFAEEQVSTLFRR
jgi:hypothetical protein